MEEKISNSILAYMKKKDDSIVGDMEEIVLFRNKKNSRRCSKIYFANYNVFSTWYI